MLNGMPRTSFLRTSSLLAAATAIAAGGWIAGATAAQALPPAPLAPGDCQQWGFAGSTGLFQSTDEDLVFNSTGPTASGPADLRQPNGVTKHGSVTGGVDPTGHIALTWTQDSGGSMNFTGAVDPTGRANGTRDPNNEVTWHLNNFMACATESPASASPGQPASKQGPTVTAEPGLAGVTFHITDRSGVTSQCTYSSEGFESSFGLPANGSFDLEVPAIRKFKNRTGKITCDNGTSTPTSVFF
jgi:hypothetical protein